MPLISVILSAILCWLLGFMVHRGLLRYRIIDQPNQRSSHTTPTVRGGGIAIIATLILFGVWFAARFNHQMLLIIGTGTLLLAIVSFIDDLKSLGVGIRLGCQVVVAVAAWIAVDATTSDGRLVHDRWFWMVAVVSGFLACIWIVGHTNAFNFMDGINGIACCQAAICGLGMALLTVQATGDFASAPVFICLTVSGAALGFLPHNFPTARMFMGDVGSAPLGFLLGVLVVWIIKSVGLWVSIPLVLLHTNFVLDTSITLLRRIARGDDWHHPHREHFYQRLVRSGKSHTFTTGLVVSLQLMVLGLVLSYTHVNTVARIGLVGFVILMWLSFFVYCEFAFRKHCNHATIGSK